jgi:hypothetical protein
VVQRQFQASLNGCDEATTARRRDCYLRDPVLGGITPALAQLPYRYEGMFVLLMAEETLAENSPWSAVFEADQDRWRVETVFGVSEGIEGLGSILRFYVNESTGLVEGVPFTE